MPFLVVFFIINSTYNDWFQDGQKNLYIFSAANMLNCGISRRHLIVFMYCDNIHFFFPLSIIIPNLSQDLIITLNGCCRWSQVPAGEREWKG